MKNPKPTTQGSVLLSSEMVAAGQKIKEKLTTFKRQKKKRKEKRKEKILRKRQADGRPSML